MDKAVGITHMLAEYGRTRLLGMCAMCERLCLHVSVCVVASVMDQAIPGMTFLWVRRPGCVSAYICVS